MEVLSKYGKEDLALLYVAQLKENTNHIIEFVESLQPPVPREDKWVLIISTLFGCPFNCQICDAGGSYSGKISKEGLFSQIDYLITQRFPNRKVPIPKLKIQFARMGEPSLNENVLTLLEELPKLYDAPGLLPCISTVAPSRSKLFFDDLLRIKNKIYPNGQFQLQFSIHTTDSELRKKIIKGKLWSFEEIAKYGEKWLESSDRKITLNFAVANNYPIDPDEILKWFEIDNYLIKLTPVNPTNKSIKNNITSKITESHSTNIKLVEKFRTLGYQTLISIGEWEENQIGSNCGQFSSNYKKTKPSEKSMLPLILKKKEKTIQYNVYNEMEKSKN